MAQFLNDVLEKGIRFNPVLTRQTNRLEMKLVLANIAASFELKLLNKRLTRPVRRGLTFAPPGKMRMVANALR